MKLEQFFTDYDDSLVADINVDPLGVLTIWSTLGQKIFRNRISSISNDVRSYTLNLFHHHVIRRMIDDETFVLSPALAKLYQSKSSLSFKQACLIHLENIFVFSHVENEVLGWVKDAITGGIFGISKARRRWNIEGDKVMLEFGHEKRHQILVRQLLLGVSGRYKTPMVEMGFFDRQYHYRTTQSEPVWPDADTFIEKNSKLCGLEKELRAYLQSLLLTDHKSPSAQFSAVPQTLKKHYVRAFHSQSAVGSYAKDYWLRVTKLNTGAAGVILEVINDDLNSGTKPVPCGVFLRAQSVAQKRGVPEVHFQLAHVLAVEPFLTDLDLLFTLMLSKQSRSTSDVSAAWHDHKRDPDTLPRTARALQKNDSLRAVLAGRGKARLDDLTGLSVCASLEEQIRSVLAYHGKVMALRGQAPWLSIDDLGEIKVHVRRPVAPAPESRGKDYWSNHYYIPQFANLIRGFRGVDG